MDEKTLRTLEFDKIRDILSKHSVNEETKAKISKLSPKKTLSEVKDDLTFTDGAVVMSLKFGTPPILAVSEIKDDFYKEY